MPPKKRAAEDNAGGDDQRKRAATSTVAGGKSVTISAPGGAPATKPGAPVARAGAATAAAGGTSKPGTVRGMPKPGVRKISAAALASRAKAVSSSAASKKETAPPVITKNTLMWFRNDLRLQDNKALHEASVRAKAAGTHLIGLFIISKAEWVASNEAPVKIDFWLRNLAKLKKALDDLSIPLIVKETGASSDIPNIIGSIVKEHSISHIHWNADYTAKGLKRDELVKSSLTSIPQTYVVITDDKCVIPPREIMTKINTPFQNFELFMTSWFVKVEAKRQYLDLVPGPGANADGAKTEFATYFQADVPSSYPHNLDLEEVERLYPAGEDTAQKRLDSFIKETVSKYHTVSYLVGHEGSNSLTPFIANGILSHRQCVSMARSVNSNKVMVGNEGVKQWVTEFILREFYTHIMLLFPRIAEEKAYIAATEDIRWSSDERKFSLWCQGKTGYPIVDAGMRQLNSVGFMNARARKIVQCFLVKDLMMSWQKGEKYFLSKLIDGDVAFNNGSWQWCAATGIDCQPYFTSNSPLTQSQRRDPHGEYIRHWVPELESLSDTQVHDPFRLMPAKDFTKLGYPRPMVDHMDAKKKYVEEYKRVLDK
ncbi:hypothetical protein BGZ94_000345 [Podila epigama]|nr:hypothetical protein BGZ94_000345 [Podila epigama]